MSIWTNCCAWFLRRISIRMSPLHCMQAALASILAVFRTYLSLPLRKSGAPALMGTVVMDMRRDRPTRMQILLRCHNWWVHMRHSTIRTTPRIIMLCNVDCCGRLCIAHAHTPPPVPHSSMRISRPRCVIQCP
jgi:hypothetical protein